MTSGLVQDIPVEESKMGNCFTFLHPRRKLYIEIKNLAGLEVINSSALIGYALQVQALLRSCQTSLINSYYIAFSLYSTTWLRMRHSEDNRQQGDDKIEIPSNGNNNILEV